MRSIDHYYCACGKHYFLFFGIIERLLFPKNYRKHLELVELEFAMHKTDCIANRQFQELKDAETHVGEKYAD